MFGKMVRIALLLLGVCGALFAADLPGVWLDVPFVKQEKDGCGAASIAMVMQYWRRHAGRGGQPDSDATKFRLPPVIPPKLMASMRPTWRATSKKRDSVHLQFAESGKT